MPFSLLFSIDWDHHAVTTKRDVGFWAGASPRLSGHSRFSSCPAIADASETAEARPEEVPSGEVWTVDMRPAEARPVEARLAEAWPAE